VEAWFPGAGWLPFDPTPLSDGRTVVPGYVARGTQPEEAPLPPPPPAVGTTAPEPDVVAEALQDPSKGDPGLGVGARIALAVVGLLVCTVLVGLIPLTVREARRRWRLHQVGVGGPDAVSAAWEEVLAESADRGVVPPVGETVRVTARRLVDEHTLDEPGQAGLQTLVGAVERTWYGSTSPQSSDTQVADRELCGALDAVRTSLTRCAPPTRMTRLLPRSVLPRKR
jgi:hypothetical protein